MADTEPVVPRVVLEALSDGQVDALLSDLAAIQATRWATAHQTSHEHEPGELERVA